MLGIVMTGGQEGQELVTPASLYRSSLPVVTAARPLSGIKEVTTNVQNAGLPLSVDRPSH